MHTVVDGAALLLVGAAWLCACALAEAVAARLRP